MEMVMTYLQVIQPCENECIDCNNGDLRLVGSQWSYEGTIEVCFGKIWGLISDFNWNQQDAEVVCRQLGYQIQGNIL